MESYPPQSERGFQPPFFDSYESVHSFDQFQLSAGRDPFTFPFPSQNPEFSGHGSFTSPTLPPQLTPHAHTLAEQHPYSVQSDQDRFWRLSTHNHFDVGLPEADWDFTLPIEPLVDFDFDFRDNTCSSLPNFEQSAVADQSTPSTAEFSSSSASSDIVNLNWPVSLLPSSSATSLSEPSQSNDVPVGILFEETVSKELPGPVDVSQLHRMRLPPITTPLKCSECAQVFASRGQLRRHERTHERFVCDIHGCERSFKMAKDLRRHQATVHAGSTSCSLEILICPSCDYKTRRKDHHKRHIATHQAGTKEKSSRGRAPNSLEQ